MTSVVILSEHAVYVTGSEPIGTDPFLYEIVNPQLHFSDNGYITNDISDFTLSSNANSIIVDYYRIVLNRY